MLDGTLLRERNNQISWFLVGDLSYMLWCLSFPILLLSFIDLLYIIWRISTFCWGLRFTNVYFYLLFLFLVMLSFLRLTIRSTILFVPQFQQGWVISKLVEDFLSEKYCLCQMWLFLWWWRWRLVKVKSDPFAQLVSHL